MLIFLPQFGHLYCQLQSATVHDMAVKGVCLQGSMTGSRHSIKKAKQFAKDHPIKPMPQNGSAEGVPSVLDCPMGQLDRAQIRGDLPYILVGRFSGKIEVTNFWLGPKDQWEPFMAEVHWVFGNQVVRGPNHRTRRSDPCGS